MFASILVDGQAVDVADEDTGTVTVAFPTDGAASYRCRACGDELYENAGGGVTGEAYGPLCPYYEPDGDDTDGADAGEGPHTPERIPLSWCNHAGISTDDADDSVTVSVSVGDPRGAFTVTIRRIPDDADSALAGRLVMHTPHPGDVLPHMPLTPLHAGTYLIGS